MADRHFCAQKYLPSIFEVVNTKIKFYIPVNNPLPTDKCTFCAAEKSMIFGANGLLVMVAVGKNPGQNCFLFQSYVSFCQRCQEVSRVQICPLWPKVFCSKNSCLFVCITLKMCPELQRSESCPYAIIGVGLCTFSDR